MGAAGLGQHTAHVSAQPLCGAVGDALVVLVPQARLVRIDPVLVWIGPVLVWIDPVLVWIDPVLV